MAGLLQNGLKRQWFVNVNTIILLLFISGNQLVFIDKNKYKMLKRINSVIDFRTLIYKTNEH
jgi:hypothetical protein